MLWKSWLQVEILHANETEGIRDCAVDPPISMIVKQTLYVPMPLITTYKLVHWIELLLYKLGTNGDICKNFAASVFLYTIDAASCIFLLVGFLIRSFFSFYAVLKSTPFVLICHTSNHTINLLFSINACMYVMLLLVAVLQYVALYHCLENLIFVFVFFKKKCLSEMKTSRKNEPKIDTSMSGRST